MKFYVLIDSDHQHHQSKQPKPAFRFVFPVRGTDCVSIKNLSSSKVLNDLYLQVPSDQIKVVQLFSRNFLSDFYLVTYILPI